MAEAVTVDVSVATFDEMEPIHEGLARRARATLGVSAWGMQVLTLPPEWDGYPTDNHDSTAFDPNQEEVYIPLAGAATLVAGDRRFELAPGMARVGPEQQRQILPGPDGIRLRTNVCLRMIERRGRESAVVDAHLQPYPDALLDPQTPEREAERRETIGLALIAAMQLLPPRQRAALVLRDVLGWSAREAADVLGISIPAANSALQRARDRLERERLEGAHARVHRPADERTESALMRKFVEAWEAVDIERLAALLTDDALMTMPPEPMHVVGPAQIGGFFATVPMEGRLDLIRLRPARANGPPALAAYVHEAPEARFHAYGIMVFAVDRDQIDGITGFAGYPELFPLFGLPAELN